MNKKRVNTKILFHLNDGYTIREVRNMYTDIKTDKTTQIGSGIHIYKGKVRQTKRFKNRAEALIYFHEEIAK